MQRQLRFLAVMTASLALPACYRYVPVDVTPTVGEQFAFELTDRGRAELADRFGPGLLRIQGRLVADSSEQYVVNVLGVTQIDGTNVTWSGERARLPHDFVGHVEGRELSKGRTAVAAVAGAVAVASFIAVHGAGWAGQSSSGTGNVTGTPAQISFLIRTLVHSQRLSEEALP